MPESVGRGSATDPQAPPATSTEHAPTESAQPPASSGPPPATDAPARETTPEAPAGQQERPWAKLTAEERRALVAEMDPDELFQANDRLGGHVGKLAQRQAQEARQRDESVRAAQRRREALQRRDPDAALEVLSEQEQADQRLLAQHEQDQLRGHWDEAVEYFTTKAPAAVRKKLAEKEYGTDPLRAGLAFWRDLAQETVAHLPALEQQLTAKLEKSIERRLRAELLGEEPSPDVGPGAGAGGSPRFTRAQIDAMSPAEYQRNRDAIHRQLATRRAGAA